MNSKTKSKKRSFLRNRLLEKKRLLKTGSPPGSLVYIGNRDNIDVEITSIRYSEKNVSRQQVTDLQTVGVSPNSVTWLNVVGLKNPKLIGKIGKKFYIHDLILEDILDTSQRPKMEDGPQNVSIILKSLNYDETTEEVFPEQLSLVLGQNYVISFQEDPKDPFDPIRERLYAGQGKLRSSGPDYLLYALIDAIVDNYFNMLEKIAEKIELVEEQLVTEPAEDVLTIIHKLKSNLIYLRRSIWPLREIVMGLAQGDTAFITEATRPFFRDVYDHTIHVVDALETYRDIVSGMLDIYLSSVSNRLSKIMKVLTTIATIFMPLSFLGSWYGMNFEHMPELKWQYGYVYVIFLALSVTAGMLIFFRRKNWI